MDDDDIVIVVSGFGSEGDVRAAIHHGKLSDVVNGVLNEIRSFGSEVKMQTVRSLDGWLREVRATVIVDPENPMWMRFLKPSEPWKERSNG